MLKVVGQIHDTRLYMQCRNEYFDGLFEESPPFPTISSSQDICLVLQMGLDQAKAMQAAVSEWWKALKHRKFGLIHTAIARAHGERAA